MSLLESRKARKLWKRQGGMCAICGLPMKWKRGGFNRDHIIPRSLGGLDRWDNYQLTHPACNTERGNEMPEYLPPMTWAQERRVRYLFASRGMKLPLAWPI